MYRKLLWIGLVLSLVSALSVPLLVSGQDDAVILTIAAPEGMGSAVFTPEVFSDFEAEHPGVKVVVVSANESTFAPPPEFGLEEHLNTLEMYAGAADVLFADSFMLTPEATRAGYFLDLAPLVAADPGLDEADFYPAVWQSWQWDNGVWGLPAFVSINMLIYNADAFDEAGLAYPSANWTLEDLLYAADALAQRDAAGKVIVPGLEPVYFGQLVRSVLGRGLYDNSVLPNPPDFARPEVVALAERWYAWLQAGKRVPGGPGQYAYGEVPLAVDNLARLYIYGTSANSDARWEATLLPGGHATLQVQGFAVSAGTEHPELAYALASYLTRQSQVVGFGGTVPARRSVQGAGVDGPFVSSEDLPRVEALQQEALANALPVSELRYAGYLDFALALLSDDTQSHDVLSALQTAEERARAALQTAEARRESVVIAIPTPVPTPVLSSGQTALKFGFLNLSTLPNQELWQQTVADFIAVDPEVGHVELVTEAMNVSKPFETFDCYYMPFTSVTVMTPDGLLSLDPFLDADPGFDSQDMIRGVFASFELNGATWAYPLDIKPAVLWVDTETFAQAGLTLPENGWSIEAFAETLVRLKESSPEGTIPFVPDGFGNTYIRLLIAAYGGVPFDHQIDPPAVNLTAPESVEAIRQVLELAQDGYIAYQELDNYAGGRSGGPAPINTDTLSTLSWRLDVRSTTGLPVQLAPYPQGSQYTPVSYDVGAAYISAQAANPAACYRWIRFVAQRPELSLGIPTARSQLGSPVLTAALGDDIVAFYREYADAFENPNLYVVPYRAPFSRWFEDIWFNRALDRVVLEDGDLEAELAAAETNIIAFRDCTAAIPPLDPTLPDEQQRAYYDQYIDCGIKIDPSLEARFRREN